VYVSAVKNAGKTVPASKLKNAALIYKSGAGMYVFKNVALRSISFNGQNLYVVQTDQEAEKVVLRNPSRLYVGAHVSARIIIDNEESAYYMNYILKDISMTDMGILSSKKIDQDSKIEISFRVNENDIERLVGKITRVNEFKNATGFLYGCDFEKPNDTIGKFVARKLQQINNGNEVD